MGKYLSIINSAAVVPGREPQWQEEVPASIKRRDPRIWQMAWLAASRVLSAADSKANSIITGTALGALDETKNVLDGVYDTGFSSPRNFIASVHNSMAGKISLEFKIPGPNLTMCEGQNSFASAVSAAVLLDSSCFPVLLLVVDERIELLDRIHPYMSRKCSEYLCADWEEAAVAFLLGTAEQNSNTLIRSLGPFPADENDPGKSCREMVLRYLKPGCIIPDNTSTSFVKPAISAFEWLNSSDPNPAAVCSYSPSSKGAAIVELLKK